MNKLRIISMLCTIAMLIGCFAMFPAFAAGEEAETEVETPTTVDAEGNGSGKENDPYLIYVSNFADYYTNYNSKYFSKHVKLMEDITVNEGNATEWAAGTNRPTATAPFGLWTGPMGGGEQALTGSFDGNGHTISGVCLVGTATTRRVSLFAGIGANAMVKDLKLTNSYFEMQTCTNSSGYDEISSFASRFDGAIINCYSDAILVNNSKHNSDIGTGGIVGAVRNGQNARIENCVFAGSITQTREYTQNVTSANNRVGGILGFSMQANTQIVNCLFVGTINAKERVGAILGNGPATVTGCMSIIKDGALTSPMGCTDFYAGGINTGNVTVKSMYVVAGLTTGCVGSGGALSGVSGTWANIKQVTLNDLNTPAVVAEGGKLAGWNFTSDSYIPNPTTLKGTDIAWASVATKWAEGKGTVAADANKLFTLDQSNFQTFWEKNKDTGTIFGHYFLTSDVKLNDGKATDWANGSLPSNVWDVAISGGNGAGLSGGSFDGQGHTISGVCLIGGTSTRRTSLFAGVSNNATLKNVKLVNSYFEGHASGNYEEAAAFASRLGGTIRNCYTDAIIVNNGTGSGECAAGGIAGRSHHNNFAAVTEAKIENCAFAGSVTSNGQSRTGGIIGFTSIKTTISNCTNLGSVKGTDGSVSAYRTGGIIGSNAGATTINNCLNMGSVTQTANQLSGGIFGDLAASIAINNSMDLSTTGTKNAIFAGGVSVVTTDTVQLNNFVAVKDIAIKNLDNANTNYATAHAAGKLIYIDSIEDLFDADIVAKGAALEGWSFKEGFMAEPSGLLEITYLDALKAKYWTESDGIGVAGKWYSLDQDNFQLFYEKMNNAVLAGNFVLTEDIIFNNDGINVADWKDPSKRPAAGTPGVWNRSIVGDNGHVRGTFDGNGYAISGVCLVSDLRRVALFGNISEGGVVKNLKFVNSYIESNRNGGGYDEVGGIVGRLGNANSSAATDVPTISNCYVDVVIVSNLVCSSTGTTGVGGIVGVGYATAGTVENCVFAGSITSTTTVEGVGGIVGRNSESTITISNCLNTGSVKSTGAEVVGGIMGTRGSGAVIKDSMDIGTAISNKNGKKWNVYGDWYTTTNLTITNVIVVKELRAGTGTISRNDLTLAGASGWDVKEVELSALQTADGVASKLAGWNFKSSEYVPNPTTLEGTDMMWYKYWTVRDGCGESDRWYSLDQGNFQTFWEKNKTTGSIYGNYILISDVKINEGDASTWGDEANRPANIWNCGITGSGSGLVSGLFDGQGHEISGICMIGGANDRRIALFAGIGSAATVKNLKLTNSYFEMNSTSGYDEIASFASRHDGAIINCYSDAILVNNNTGNDSTATGGIVGAVRNSENARIENCVFVGSITQTNSEVDANGRVGGILGYTQKANTSIKNCLFNGTIDAKAHVGAILGNMSATVTITDCLNLSNKLSSPNGCTNIYAGGINGSVTVNSFYSVYGLSVAGYASGKDYAGAIAGGWTNIYEKDPSDFINGTYLKDWHYVDGYVPNPTTLEGTDIAWDSLIIKWEAGRGTTSADVKVMFALDQSNFQTFWESNKTNGMLYGHYILTSDVKLNDGIASTWVNAENRPSNIWDCGITGNGSGLISGSFNGQGHTISGICLIGATTGFGPNGTDGARRVSLFAGIGAAATLKNLKLTNSYFEMNSTSGYDEIASFASRHDGAIINCYSDAILVNNNTGNDSTATGGIVGAIRNSEYARIENCVFAGSITQTNSEVNVHGRVGGILGYTIKANTRIKNCLFNGTINAKTYVGAIIGNAGATVTVTDCLNLSNKLSSPKGCTNIYAGGKNGNVVVTSFYRVKGLGMNYYASGCGLSDALASAESNPAWNVTEITLAEFLNGDYLAGWIRVDGYAPAPTANVKIPVGSIITADYIGLDSTGAVHSVRISPTEPGLRFETKVDAAALAALEKLGYTVEMKTYITLAAYASSVDFTTAALTANKMPYLTVGATKYLRTEAEDGYTAFAGSVVNVKDLTRVYAGIGCITLTKDGQSYDIYAKYNKDENASVSGVAFIAACDTKAASETGYTHNIIDIYGNSVYSPYDKNQYQAIKVLMGETPETAILNYGIGGKTNYTASMSKVSANAVSADEATDVYSDWTKWAAQGGCIVDGYIYTVMWSNNVDGKTNPNKCVIVKTNLSDGKVVAKSAALDLGHGNDLTFNGTYLVTVACNLTQKVFFIDPADLTIKGEKVLKVTPGDAVCSIDYNEATGGYVGAGVQNAYLYMYDADFNLVRTISGAGMTKGTAGAAFPDGSYSMQGIMTDGSYVYILGWHGGDTWAEEGSMSSLEHFFTSGVKSSIRVVDLASGAFVQDIDLGIEREVEFVDYENGMFYIGCNNNMWTGMEFYTGTIK